MRAIRIVSCVLVATGIGCARPLHPDSVSLTTFQSDVASQNGKTSTGVGVTATWNFSPVPVVIVAPVPKAEP